MMRRLWKTWTSQAKSTNAAPSLDAEMLLKVREAHRASDLREALRAHAKSPSFYAQQLPSLIDQLHTMRWPVSEIEKVLAYADFFSGADERGYTRVMQHALARDDYLIFMTACTHCYLADRFTEGAALLDLFRPNEDPETDWCEYWAFAGYIHFAAGRSIDYAVHLFDQALEKGCFSALLAVNAYPIYFEAGRLEQCYVVRELIRKHYFEDPEALFALACVELARGFYGEGFRLMEARYRMPELARSLNISLMSKPRWEGQETAGKRLLIHGEQGLGDMIMMARYLPLLHAQGACLLIDGRPEASTLMTHNFPYCQFIEGDAHTSINVPFDYWTGLMSLPYQFKTTVLDVPSCDGYMGVPDEQASYWRERVRATKGGRGGLRVGLAWSGNPGHRADKRRSIQFELICKWVRSHADIQFFPLQTHVPASHPANMIDVADELLTMADTAALIAEMDVTISVDTSPIHLAGALGRPAWLLLPRRYEWRWGLEGETNPWYRSVRVWRQVQSGDWSTLLHEVSDALQHLKTAKTGGEACAD